MCVDLQKFTYDFGGNLLRKTGYAYASLLAMTGFQAARHTPLPQQPKKSGRVVAVRDGFRYDQAVRPMGGAEGGGIWISHGSIWTSATRQYAP